MIDAQWLFFARPGDFSKIIEYLAGSANKNPERALATLKRAEANGYSKPSEIMQIPRISRQKEVEIFMEKELRSVLEKIIQSGGNYLMWQGDQ